MNVITPVPSTILSLGSILLAGPSRYIYSMAVANLPEEIKLSYQSSKSEAAAFELELSLRVLI